MECETCRKPYVHDHNAAVNNEGKPHVCRICGYSFSLKIQLKRHALLHVDGTPFTCVNCDKDNDNLRLTKKESGALNCDDCGENFSSKRLLLKHVDSEHSIGIQISSSGTLLRNDDHKQQKKRDRALGKDSSSEDGQKPSSRRKKRLICAKCGTEHLSRSAFYKHLYKDNCKPKANADSTEKSPNIEKRKRGRPKGIGSSVVVEAGKKIKVEVKEERKHVCKICGKGFMRKSSLEGHNLLHVSEDNLDSDSTGSLDDTVAVDSDNYYDDKTSEKTKEFKISKSFMCGDCNFVCFSKQTLNKHRSNHKSPPIKALSREMEQPNFRSNSENVNRQIIKGKSSQNRTKKKELNYLCDFCEREFTSTKRLLRHVCRKDLAGTQREKKYSCRVCDRKFAGKACLLKHLCKDHGIREGIYEHDKTRELESWTCEFCSEVFSGKKSIFVKHVNAHAPEVCGICDARFTDRASLREHCKVHLGTEEGRIFLQCSQKRLDMKNALHSNEGKVEYIYLVIR